MKKLLNKNGKKSTATKKRRISDEKMMEDIQKALNAPMSEAKVPVNMGMDSDIYMELRRRAEAGEAGGKYQVLINQLLRVALFGQKVEVKPETLDDILRRINSLEKKIAG